MEFIFQIVTAKYGHDFLQVLQEMRENEKKLSQNRLAILPFRYSERSAKQMCVFCFFKASNQFVKLLKM